jgi:hypothetical protein
MPPLTNVMVNEGVEGLSGERSQRHHCLPE